MKFEHATPLARAGIHNRLITVAPKTNKGSGIYNSSTGPPNRCVSYSDDIKVRLPPRGAWWLISIPYWLATFCIIASSIPAPGQPELAGSKLVGAPAGGPAEQGWSVALSADGSTAIVGGLVENKLTGAVWVFSRNGGKWAQQGDELVGTGSVGHVGQGSSVALSADGNTAIVGGPYDNSNAGAAWIYTRSGGVWSQQGGKLVGIGAVGKAVQGVSVSLSADGNTALVGGTEDNSGTGAAWVFTRSGDRWIQQGSRLVGAGAVGIGNQGSSVALSADGNTALVGGPLDNSSTGAVWVYSRSGGAWIQQGSKLVGTGAVGQSAQGFSIALSADGNTFIVGALGDNSHIGAAWVYSRGGTVWTQQGGKLVGAGAVGAARQGHSVALSADGNTAIVGGPYDNSDAGAAWIYSRSRTVWTQQGNKLIGAGAVGRAEHGFSVALSADGSTALAGGIADNRLTGAAWVHNRSGDVWTPIPAPLLGY
jgi:antibiotic biosynthesis monooxygenase (ABM) superfamily enzyme